MSIHRHPCAAAVLSTLAIGLALVGPALATSYYVDPATGSDGNDGSLAFPWRTVKPKLAAMAPGDSLVLRDGVYDLANQGGAANLLFWSPTGPDVSLVAYPGDTPIIDYAGVAIQANQQGLVLHASDRGFRVDGLHFTNWVHNLGVDDDSEHLGTLGADSVIIRGCVWEHCGGDFFLVRIRNAAGGSQDVAIISALIIDSEPHWRQPFELAGDNDPSTLERFIVRDCFFNDVGSLDALDGGRPAITAHDVDSLVIADCFGYNPGNVAGGETDGTDFIYLNQCTRVSVSRCQMIRYIRDWERPTNGDDHPLHNSDGLVITTGCDSVWVDDCMFWGAGHGIEVISSSNVWITATRTDSTYDDAVYVDNGSAGGSISGCVFHWTGDNGIDMKGDDYTIAHNTIVRTHYSSLSVWGTSENVAVRDNIAYDVGRSDVHLAREGDWTADAIAIDWDHNLYWSPEEAERVFEVCEGGCATYEWSEWQSTFGHDPNGVLADPIFASPYGRAFPRNSRDFQLVTGSPGIGTASDGTNIGAIQGQVVAIDPSPNSVSPIGIALAPNPFTHHTSLTLTASANAMVSVRIFDAGGRLVRTLADHAPARPTLHLQWDGRDDAGRSLAAGVYFYRFVTGDRSVTRPIIRVR